MTPKGGGMWIAILRRVLCPCACSAPAGPPDIPSLNSAPFRASPQSGSRDHRRHAQKRGPRCPPVAVSLGRTARLLANGLAARRHAARRAARARSGSRKLTAQAQEFPGVWVCPGAISWYQTWQVGTA